MNIGMEALPKQNNAPPLIKYGSRTCLQYRNVHLTSSADNFKPSQEAFPAAGHAHMTPAETPHMQRPTSPSLPSCLLQAAHAVAAGPTGCQHGHQKTCRVQVLCCFGGREAYPQSHLHFTVKTSLTTLLFIHPHGKCGTALRDFLNLYSLHVLEDAVILQ